MGNFLGITGLMLLCMACGNLPTVNAERPASPAERADRAGWHESSLVPTGSQTRAFRYYVPPNLPAHAPVVILFHGGTQSMTKIFQPNAGGSQAWPPLADREKFLLIVPNGVNPATGDGQGDRQNWNDCRPAVAGSRTATTADDVEFTRQLIAWSETHYAIDSHRVYATGASNGGEMAYRLAIELSDKIAGAAAFIANLPATSDCQAATQPVPMMIMNGTADPLMPWSGGMVNGDAGEVLSTQATLDYWLKVNRSATRLPPTRKLPNLDVTDSSSILETTYPARPAGAEVVFYQVEGGGHAMPSRQYPLSPLIQRRLTGPQNRDLEGAEAAWAFLKRQQR
jgi:polyhydroxybutyrate depolymerase